MKNTYSSPRLVVHGTVENITRGNATGTHTDQTFTETTPGEELTFTGGTDGDYDPDA